MTLPAAESELTDAEIHERYGALVSDALSAFRTDPEYVIAMMEYRAVVEQRRKAKRAYKNRKRESDT